MQQTLLPFEQSTYFTHRSLITTDFSKDGESEGKKISTYVLSIVLSLGGILSTALATLWQPECAWFASACGENALVNMFL